MEPPKHVKKFVYVGIRSLGYRWQIEYKKKRIEKLEMDLDSVLLRQHSYSEKGHDKVPSNLAGGIYRKIWSSTGSG